MRYTLLEIVQLLLAAMDSDEVSSISDTVESNQVALLLKSVYYDCATDLALPEHDGLFELNASGDANKPVLMTVPTNVVRIDWIKYNNILTGEDHPNYQPVEYMPFNKLLDMMQALRENDSNIDSMTFTNNSENFEWIYVTNKMPQYFTSVDDYTLLFDSYYDDEDTTLQKSKSMAGGSVYPAFTLSDSFEPDLDPTQFSYYINRAKVRAFAELKQAENVEAASEARRQKIITQKRKRTVPNETEHARLANYGRK